MQEESKSLAQCERENKQKAIMADEAARYF